MTEWFRSIVLLMLLGPGCGASIASEAPSSFSLLMAQADATDTTDAVDSVDSAEEAGRRLGIVGKATVFVDNATVYVDEAQRKASERFGNWMGEVDGFFSNAGANDDAVSNESWARIRFDAGKPGGEDFKFKPSLKVRVVLPETERRLKLLFSTEDDDTEIVGQTAERGIRDNQDASFAFRFIRRAKTNLRSDIDIGIRQRQSLIQFFTRLKLGYRKDLPRSWKFRANNSWSYFNKSGFEDRLSFDFRRIFFSDDDVFLRSFTEFSWRNGRQGAIITQIFGQYAKIDESRSLAVELLATYYTSLNEGIDDRFRGHELRVRWRHNVWRPWFFYEVWPSVSWPSTNDYEKAYGILLRVEMIIGQK